jgi:hypothetical protein
MKSIILALTLTSTFSFAETGTFTVKGMHCSGCKEAVQEKVCKSEAAKNAESCTVSITDETNESGQVVIKTKPGTKIDVAAIEKQVAAVGTKYTVTKVDLKDMFAEEKVAGDLKGTAVTTTTTVTEAETTPTSKKSSAKKTKKIVTKMSTKPVQPTETAAPAPTAPKETK